MLLLVPLTKPTKKSKSSIDKNLLDLGGKSHLTELINKPKKG